MGGMANGGKSLNIFLTPGSDTTLARLVFSNSSNASQQTYTQLEFTGPLCDASRNIGLQYTAANAVYCNANGWIDRRGQDGGP